MTPTFETTHARRSDPGTSHMAAKRAKNFADTHKGRILAAIQRCGHATAHSISCYTGLSIVQVDRRTKDLQRDGLIEVVQENGRDKMRGPYRVLRAIDQSFAAMGDQARAEMGHD